MDCIAAVLNVQLNPPLLLSRSALCGPTTETSNILTAVVLSARPLCSHCCCLTPTTSGILTAAVLSAQPAASSQACNRVDDELEALHKL
jgi:hypothetical protein